MKYYVFCLQDFFAEDLKLVLRKNKAYFFSKEEFENSLSLREGLFLKKLQVTPIIDRKTNLETPKEVLIENPQNETNMILSKILNQLEVISQQLEKQQNVSFPQRISPQANTLPFEEKSIPSFLPSIEKNNSSIEIKENVSNSSQLQDSLKQLRIRKK